MEFFFVASSIFVVDVTERCQDSKNDFNRVYDVITSLMQTVQAHVLRHIHICKNLFVGGLLEVPHFQFGARRVRLLSEERLLRVSNALLLVHKNINST